MYLPAHFEQPDVADLQHLIVAHPFGTIVADGPDGLDANHLPFELDRNAGEHGRLIAHVARANPLWKEMAENQEVLVIFRGPHAYISPNWYPSKHELHRQVPTWNYQVVHVHGRIHIHDDEKFVRGVVARLTRTHEARTASERPWRMTDSAADYIDEMVKAIVGIEVEIHRIVGKWKLSQNKENRDRINAAAELRARGEHALADAMLSSLEPPK